MVRNHNKIFQTERKMKYNPNKIMSRIAPYNDITVLNIAGALLIADIEGDQGLFEKEWKFSSKDEEGDGFSEHMTTFHQTLVERQKSHFKRAKKSMKEGKRIQDIRKYCHQMMINGTLSDADFY